MSGKVKTNDLKAGTKVKLRNGFNAILRDNKTGQIRLAEVSGLVEETGSIYAHNIVRAFVDGKWRDVQHTPKQLALKRKLIYQGLEGPDSDYGE